MKKAILLLSGVPESKKLFAELARKLAWVWEINPKEKLSEISTKNLYASDENREDHYSFLEEFHELVNRRLGFEKNFLLHKIRNFKADDSENKHHEGLVFDSFLLIAHGVSKANGKMLQEEYGAFKIYVTNTTSESVGAVKNNDVILHSNAENFEEEVIRVLNILLKGT